MDNKRFIYFDVGGVLLDWTKVFETAAAKFNIKARDIGRVFEENHDSITKGFVTPREFWEKCIQKYGIKNAENYDFLDSWVSDFQPIKEVHDLIFKIKSQYNIGLLSNIYKGMKPLLLEKNIIPNIEYKQIIFSCDVGMMKPNLDIYELAQQKAQTDAKNILFIDDREDFLVEAQKLQWNTFLFDNMKRSNSVKELEEYLIHY